MRFRDRRPSPSERLFGRLLILFPRHFRDRFGRDMRELFRDQLRAARAEAGARGVAGLWRRTVPSFLRAAFLERLDALRDRPAFQRHPGHLGPHHGRRGRPRRDEMLETFAKDLRLASRVLRKSPVFTLVGVLVIALGTGAVTTVASAANALLLRPLPGTADPDRLVSIERTREDGDRDLEASYPYFEHLRRGSRTLDGVAAWTRVDLAIGIGGEAGQTGGTGAVRASGSIVSGNYFEVLGVRPALGRLFAPNEGGPGPERPVIVVSEVFWRSRLGADPGTVGRTLRVNGRPYWLIGVAPADFRGVFTPLRTDAWVSLGAQPHLRPGRNLGDTAATWLRLFGRLADGARREAAQDELAALTAGWTEDGAEPAELEAWSSVELAGLTGLPPEATRPVLAFLGALFVPAALVLLIASVNVASMLSARAVARRGEMAVRTALGAGRGRLIRQLLTETLLLFVLGAAGGVVLALVATSALELLPLPADLPVALDLSPDPGVLFFTLLVSLLTGVLFGTAPALEAARKDVAARLRHASSGRARRALTGKALIVGQLAGSLLLLVAAGLFLRALERGQRIHPGFESSGVATVSLDAGSWGYDEPEARAFYRALREKVEAIPGVRAVGFAGFLPLAGGSSEARIEVADAPGRAGRGEAADQVAVQVADVDVGYFSVLRLPILRGRAFRSSDHETAPRVAVVNETFARRLHPEDPSDRTRSALGSRFRFRGEPVTVVGIARDAKYFSLTEETPPFVYFPEAQLWRPSQTLMVRTDADPRELRPALERALHDLDPSIPPPTVVPLEDATAVALLPQKVASATTGALGAIGLLLAAVGLYGIIAYSVSQRTREIGVRVALGARRRDVLGTFAGEGARLAAVAVVIGLLLAAGATRLMSRFLFGMSPLDTVTFVGTAVLFLAVALLASVLAGRRAAGTDPVTALSSE